MKLSELLDVLDHCTELKCNIYFESEYGDSYKELTFKGYIADTPYWLAKLPISKKYPIEYVDKGLKVPEGWYDDAGFVIVLDDSDLFKEKEN